MTQFSLLAEENFQLYVHKLILVVGDRTSWIEERDRDYFPKSIYQLCPFHLERNLIQILSYNRIRQSEIRSLLGKGQITEALSQLEQERKENPKKCRELTDFITYLLHNREWINAIDRLQ